METGWEKHDSHRVSFGNQPSYLQVIQQMPCNGGHLAPYLYVVGYIDRLLRSAVYSATWRLQFQANVSFTYRILNPLFPFISSYVDRRGFTRHYWILVLTEFTKEKLLNVERHSIFIPFRFHFDINHSFILESRCEAHGR